MFVAWVVFNSEPLNQVFHTDGNRQLWRVRLGMCFRFTTPIIAEQTRR